MPTRSARRFARTWMVALVLASLVACKSSSGSGNPMNPTAPGGGGGGGGGPLPNSAGTLTFLLDGQQWTSILTIAENNTQTGGFAISGQDSTQRFVAFAIRNTGIGSYPIEVNSTTNMSFNTPATNENWWANGVSGGSGTVVVTAWTSTTAAGTFMFTLVPVPGSAATGNRTVAQGTFNVTYTTTSEDGR